MTQTTEKLKKFTILHSNDMHGDFLAEAKSGEGNLIGGLSLLSGYINKVRQTEKNTLYVISGDMLQGSMIDTEFKGLSTMEIMALASLLWSQLKSPKFNADKFKP